jgi:hypothetical protein
VIADHAERGIELLGDLARTGDALLEDAENRYAKRMRERLGDLGI